MKRPLSVSIKALKIFFLPTGHVFASRQKNNELIFHTSNQIHKKQSVFLYLTATLFSLPSVEGARGGVVVKALRYKPAGRGFIFPMVSGFFSMT